MTLLASVAELNTLLQDEVDNDVAEQALAMSSAMVRNYTRQTITEETSTGVVVRPHGRLLFLPELPVDADSLAVTVDGEAFTDFDVDARTGIVRRDDGRAWPETVTVTYTHGHSEVPDDVRFVTLSLASRQIDNPEGVSTKQTPDIGSVTYAEGQGQPGLRRWEKMLLDQYRVSL